MLLLSRAALAPSPQAAPAPYRRLAHRAVVERAPGLHALSYMCIIETFAPPAGGLCGRIYQSMYSASGSDDEGYSSAEWLDPKFDLSGQCMER